MKTFTLLAAITVTILNGVGTCQISFHNGGEDKPQGHKVLTASEFTTAMINNMLTTRGSWANMNVPRLCRMGDGAATEILNIMKTRGPLAPYEQQNALLIIHKSFELPSAITIASNRTTPQASFALLDQITASTTDFALKLQIADVKQFVVDTSLKTGSSVK